MNTQLVIKPNDKRTFRSKPERTEGLWRIRRYDGELVGWYETKALAEQAIRKAPYLH